jgi:hypothetical protein
MGRFDSKRVTPGSFERFESIQRKRGRQLSHYFKAFCQGGATMKNQILYLNNSGSRWIVLENDKRSKITLETKSGKKITRSVNFYESFGNFATANICYKGKKINVFSDSTLDD